MSRSIVQTVNLHDGTKILLLDTKQMPKDVSLYKVVAHGEVLPKATKAEPKHIHKAKPSKGNAGVILLTCNEAGKYKQYWDTEKDGAKPKNTSAKKKAKVDTTTQSQSNETMEGMRAEMADLKAMLAAALKPQIK